MKCEEIVKLNKGDFLYDQTTGNVYVCNTPPYDKRGVEGYCIDTVMYGKPNKNVYRKLISNYNCEHFIKVYNPQTAKLLFKVSNA